MAEEQAAKSLEEESKQSSFETAQSDLMQQEQKDDSKAKIQDEPVVMLPEKDFLAMKARLDAMEVKVKSLESVRPGTTFIIPLEADPNVENIGKQPPLQPADQATGREELQSKLEKKKGETPSEVQNQKDDEVLQGSERSSRSWFGFRSKPQEKELSG
ncbi:unnamed protein product [Calypogeia fissa]